MTSGFMESKPPLFMKLLGNELRWNIVQALALSDHYVQELAQLVHKPQNLVSYHLQTLRENHVVVERRSAHDRRAAYYSLNHETLRAMYQSSADDLSPLIGEYQPSPQAREKLARSLRVLFLCTHNSARSQMAEALLRARGEDLVEVFSAGNDPQPVHPLAVRVLAEAMQIDISRQTSKGMDRFLGQSFDYIITVCDRARESCPVFPGDPVRIHWSFPDPAEVEGSEEERYEAFRLTAVQLNTRISHLLLIMQRGIAQ